MFSVVKKNYKKSTNEIKLFSKLTNQSGRSYSNSPPFNLFKQKMQILRKDLHYRHTALGEC